MHGSIEEVPNRELNTWLGAGVLTLDVEAPVGAALLQQRTALLVPARPRGGGGARTMERNEQVAAIASAILFPLAWKSYPGV